MHRPLLRALALAALALPAPALASAFGRFQHGGRATGQAGAFVARADSASAVTYNPAGLAQQEGLGLELGLDFDAPRDDSTSATGEAAAEHSIQFPPALYLGWRPAGARWALGLGVDSPLWRFTDWDTARFPGRFTARRSEARLFELHPATAFAIDERWSVGGGLRWVTGEVGYGDTRSATVPSAGGDLPVEVDRLAEADADGWGIDLGIRFATGRWGAGAVWKSAVELDGGGDLTYLVRDLGTLPDDAQAAARARFRPGSSDLADALPERFGAGVWIAASDRLRFELDAELARWASAETPSVTDEPAVLGPDFEISRRAGWNDTLALRLGAELDLGAGWTLGAGLAREESPVGAEAIEPGAPRGDATVVAVGASWSLDWLTFDLGWSLHDHDAQRAVAQEPDPSVRTTYEARAQVWSVSARWRL